MITLKKKYNINNIFKSSFDKNLKINGHNNL